MRKNRLRLTKKLVIVTSVSKDTHAHIFHINYFYFLEFIQNTAKIK